MSQPEHPVAARAQRMRWAPGGTTPTPKNLPQRCGVNWVSIDPGEVQ